MANRPRRPQGKAWEAAADRAGHEVFDPLNRVNLGRSLETALLSRPLTPLATVGPFWGSGIYAIYFDGPQHHDLYGPLAGSSSPIYVGRAVPRGARKGLLVAEVAHRTRSLWGRLDEHADSIDEATNLDVENFRCRWLVADMLFVPMGESLIIQTYRPLWNVLIDGFGNHDPGSGRHDQERSPWDTIHPGRPWASRLATPTLTDAYLRAQIADQLTNQRPGRAPTIPPLTKTALIEPTLWTDEEL